MTVASFAGAGASSAGSGWSAIDWHAVERRVRRLQVRIAKATAEGRWGKVDALQRLLTHSFYAKLLAVKRVTGNRGAKTPGVDGLLWKTARQKFEAAMSLRRRGYRPQPLRRMYIPKKNNQQRPLGIPTMADRACQALHWFALEPVSETLEDRNAYGFRPKRSTADAIAQCFLCLCKKTSSQWILEGDIKSCFDQIDHDWLLSNIPMDKEVLHKWLKAGYLEKTLFYPTEMGTPQGGIISPTLMLMTLRGLEDVVSSATTPRDKVHVIAYADDFVITGVNKQLLVDVVQPAVEAFLRVRGLQLSQEKTLITHIEQGFDFLGFNVRKYNGKLLIKPAKKNVLAFLGDIRSTIRLEKSSSSGALIRRLNPKIQGWANYYRHVVSKRTFSYVDHAIFHSIWKWSTRRHPNKGAWWVEKKYFQRQGLRYWIFCGQTIDRHGMVSTRQLIRASDTTIRRHIKVRSDANPYSSFDEVYFEQRSQWKRYNYLTAVAHHILSVS
jgi:RNA-directed DNA polymerase